MRTAVYHNAAQCKPYEFKDVMDQLVKRFITQCPSVGDFQIQHSICATSVPYNGLGSKSEILVSILITYKVAE